jgi:hypothetical protein
LVLRRAKLRLHYMKPSKSKEQKSISLEKRAEGAYADTVAKRRAGWNGTGSDYLFSNAKREIPKSQFSHFCAL